ncbi:PAS domain-containing sensor histidine kinase [Bacteroidota bacterium]
MVKINRFYVIIIVRIILIALTCFVFFWLLPRTSRMYSTIFAGFLISIQTYWLIYYVDRVNRDISRFLLYFREGESITGYSRKRIEKDFSGLIDSFAKISSEIVEIRVEREKKEQFLNTIVKNVSSGIISYNENGIIDLYNETAKNIFNCGQINNIDGLEIVEEGLSEKIKSLSPGKPEIIRLNINNEVVQLNIRLSKIIDDSKTINLLSFQNIKVELENKELDSWQRLIRVLTHEISNSLTPINTLITAVKRSISNNGQVLQIDSLTQETLNNALSNINLVEERSKGLIEFVGEYRKLTRIPKPKMEIIKLKDLFHDIRLLMQKEILYKKIIIQFDLKPENVVLEADKNLIEQIIINLIKNSAEAFEENTSNLIHLKAEEDKNKNILIHIVDNGPGIPEDIINDIFIPFYTTKENGSGIGLSLTRQIMTLHGGTISVHSVPNVTTVFTLKF